MIGQNLGHYRIEAQLGAGGMGVVYRATDTKLGRQVAIKVLPELFAKDPERLARFKREAQMLAALNHPNIAAIHGLEESGATHYLVLELVPGPTLAEKLKGRTAAAGGSGGDRRADGGSVRGGAREGDHAPGLEAGQREDHAGGQGKGAGLRAGQAVPTSRCRRWLDRVGGGDAGGSDRGDGGVHESGAVAGIGGGQADRHLGVRVCGVRDAGGAEGVCWGDDLGLHCGGVDEGAGLGGVAGRDAVAGAGPTAPLFAEGSAAPIAGHRRRAAGASGSGGGACETRPHGGKGGASCTASGDNRCWVHSGRSALGRPCGLESPAPNAGAGRRALHRHPGPRRDDPT